MVDYLYSLGRSKYLNQLVLNTAVLSLLLNTSCDPKVSESQRMPNVVIIYLDQMAFYALGSYGNFFVRTPHMDSLAENGVRFELGITNNPLCTPARASLLSGQYSRTALGAVGNEPADKSSHRTRAALLDPTLPEIFKQAGYQTATIGKWHMPSDPFLLGFDYAVHATDPAEKYYGRTFRENHKKNAAISIENAEETFIEEFVFDFLSEKTNDYIAERANKDSPFFLYYTIELPHMPIGPNNLPEKYVTMYDPKSVPLRNNVVKNGKLAHDEWWFKVYTIPDYIFRNVPNPVPDRKSDKLPEKFNIRDLTAYYYGAVSAADDLVGKVMQALEKADIVDNTIVVLSSDHGENLGSHHWFNKDLLIEESIRIPMIFHYPADLKPLVNRDQVASMIDIMPTLLEMIGLKGPESMQGQSLLPVLQGKTQTLPRNHAIIETEFYHIGIRTPTHLYGMEILDTGFIDEWPYFPNKPGVKRTCLFDLKTDPYQKKNLAGQSQYATLEENLHQKLTKWNNKTPWLHGSPPPLPNWMQRQ